MNNKRFSILTIILSCVTVIFICLICGCTQPGTAAEPPTEETIPPETQTQPPTEDACRLLLESMTNEQKAGQTIICGMEGYEPDDSLKSLIQEKFIGGVIIYADNVQSTEQLCALTNSIKESSYYNFPPIIGMDCEGGEVTRMPDGVTGIPNAYTIARTGSEELCMQSGEIIGEQLKSFGFSTGFSPDLDIWSNPDNTVIAERAYGTTADEVSKYAISAMKGIMSTGVTAVGKHFPGHGDTTEDSHNSLPVITKTKEELEQSEFLPFKAAVDNGIPAIMTGHLLCTEIDNENPATMSKTIVTDILKNELGFNGVVFTDDLTMEAITEQYSVGDAAVMALNAGCDVLMVCHGYDNALSAADSILSALENGSLSEERLNNAVYKILKMKASQNITVEQIETPELESLNQRANELTEKTESLIQQ